MIQRLRRPSGLDQCPGFTYARGSMFYSGRDVAHGYELWKSDGTVDGTVIVKDIARGSDSSSPSNLVHVGNEVLFAVFSPRFALWASNGTRVGTRIVHRLHEWYSPLSSNPVLGGRMFYYTYEGGYGAEPWVTDGTRERTVMVKDINPGPPDSSPLGATAFGHALFFMADDGEHGYELWQTEGGEAGASLVMDINPVLRTGGPTT